MQAKERIKKIFKHEQPDRIGIFDFFDEITIINWQKQALLPTNIDISEYFDFDLDFKAYKPGKNKFAMLALNGPFQQMAAKCGLQQALIDLAREPQQVKEFFKNSLNNIFSEYKKHKEKGLRPDGIWLYEDIAYDNGLYFSEEKYKNSLFDFHKEISLFFENEGLFTVFHCDGNIEKLLLFLIKAGFSGTHPVQESCNPNILRIKKDCTNAITFMGAVSIGRLKGYHQDIIEKIEALKENANYIFCFDGPIPQDTEFNIYKDLLTQIHEAGAYR